MQEVDPDCLDEEKPDLKDLLLGLLDPKDDMSTRRALKNGRGKFRAITDLKLSYRSHTRKRL